MVEGEFMDGWWDEIDGQIEKALGHAGGLSPADLAREIGLSEAATVSVLSRLAVEGRIRITRVESAQQRTRISAA
jgi:DNA-binding MarR family transcriptional regulator